jgi:class 3 adenylate cyclase/tetratricopeptide (TPR) repeat protein
MRCSKCGADNRETARYCDGCGAQFPLQCPSCGTLVRAGARFCDSCGAGLDGAASATAADSALAPVSAAGERRHLTVLFCDLVGSTEIAARLDPEEWREIVASYHRATTEAITRFGGHVAHYLGDGVMAYFGWPEAHDNDAERAARAGLAILHAIARVNEQATRPRLSARIGINSGAVVVGASAGKQADVFGDTPNIAARVQTAALPNTVLITADTHRLISGLFVVEDSGAQTLKGIERSIQLYQVIRPSGARGRLEATAAARGLTPFVGRDDELQSLLKRWELVLDGEGQVALIVGEAGIGKSRLVQRFHDQIAATPHTWVEAAAAPLYQNTPFYPVSEVLHQLVWQQNFDRLDGYLRELQIRDQKHERENESHRDQPADEQLALLESGLALAGLRPAEAIPLIAPLLNVRISTKYPPSPLNPEQQRRHLLATLVEWLLGASHTQPLVIVTEDLHWADPSTLELIQLLVEQGAAARLLLLYTARPEFRARWPLRAHHTQITLNRLSTPDVRMIVWQVAAQKALSEETIAAVVDRTSGVPLFVEELTRAVLESGNKLTGREIPVTLHDSLMSRLDRLGPAKEVIQVGAVIGGEFSYELLHAVHPIEEADLQRALRNLADADLLYVRGIAPDAAYRFKHALIRDAAYEALLKSRRKELHRLVAHSIEQEFPALKETHPEVVARHWTEAGETEAAIAEWLRAGKAAKARHAFREALESYQQSLSLLDMLPACPERDLRELELRQTLVQMLHVTRGYSAPETIDATARAATLAERSGSMRQFLNVLIARGVNALSSGDLPAAGAVADQALELAIRESSSSSLLGRVHALQMMVRYYRGDLAAVENHLTAGLKFFDDPSFQRVPGSTAAAFGTASCNAWTRGQPDVARAREAKMMLVADRDKPYDLAFAGFEAAQLRVYMREYEQAEALATRALELSEKHQFPWLAALSRCALGRARAQQGRATDGVALIREGIGGLLEIGSRFSISNFAASLAAGQVRAGSSAEALETIEQALQANPDELVYRPEIFCLRGALRLNQEQRDTAEGDFRESIALARKMGAKAWELRTTMSLARLLDEQGRRDEACEMLADIYNWFTEGFDTADLKEAKVLLDDLKR